MYKSIFEGAWFSMYTSVLEGLLDGSISHVGYDSDFEMAVL